MLHKILAVMTVFVSTILTPVNQIKLKTKIYEKTKTNIMYTVASLIDISSNKEFDPEVAQETEQSKSFFSYAGNTPISFSSFNELKKTYTRFKFAAGSFMEFSTSNSEANEENSGRRHYSFTGVYDMLNIFPPEKLTAEQRRGKESSPVKGRDGIRINYKYEAGFGFGATEIDATAYFSIGYDDTRKSLFGIYKAGVKTLKADYKLVFTIKIPSIIFIHKDNIE